jgi:hypothetical protein
MPDIQNKETVFVVHGTFAAPNYNSLPEWYEPEGSFCRELDKALKRRGEQAQKPQGSVAATWRHDPNPAFCEKLNKAFADPTIQADDDDNWLAFLSDEEKDSRSTHTASDHQKPPSVRPWKAGDRLSFFWDGRNNWKSRKDAADLLRGHLQQLHRDGWRCHIVAHSHGGNVVLDALTSGTGKLDEMPEWFDGHIVLLGTPVIESTPSNDYDLPPPPLTVRIARSLVKILYVIPWFILSAIPSGWACETTWHGLRSPSRCC